MSLDQSPLLERLQCGSGVRNSRQLVQVLFSNAGTHRDGKRRQHPSFGLRTLRKGLLRKCLNGGTSVLPHPLRYVRQRDAVVAHQGAKL